MNQQQPNDDGDNPDPYRAPIEVNDQRSKNVMTTPLGWIAVLIILLILLAVFG